jgi:Domain of unknown function (DUF4365)
MTNERNPLPKADLQSQQERKSIKSFQAFLPEDRFVFRDERITDAGVDGSLEIVSEGNYTNMRAQVQLKSQHKKEARLDGVSTLSIETSNFNYLLNGPLGLYVLYIVETDELFYAWADDENSRRIGNDTDWRNQGSISIPFQELNILSLDNIYERILQKARLYREVSEALARAPSNDNISVSINPETLEIENSVEIEKILISAGITLVAAGYSKIVLEKLGLISAKACGDARFKLISGYANYATGRYQIALGLVAESIISGDLKDEDKKFAQGLHLSCQLNLGLITDNEYYREAENQSSGDEILEAETKLQKLAILFRSTESRGDDTLREIEELKNKIIASNKSPESLKLSTRVKYLEIIGFDSIRGILEEIFKIGARRNGNILVPLDTQLQDLSLVFQKFENWNQEADDLIQDAINIGHPIFAADALVTKAFIILGGIISKISFAEFEDGFEDQNSIQNDTLFVLKLSNQALTIYKQANMIEGEVRAQLIMAQVFEIRSQVDAAKNLARGVLIRSKYLGYKRHVETAEEILSENTLFMKNIQSVRDMLRKKDIGEYAPSALNTDEERQHLTDFMMETYQIPSERRENVLIDVFSLRDLAKEKTQWCKHIEVFQNLKHTFSPDTIYVKNPNRHVRCSKLGYVVDHRLPEWIGQIEEFKKTYCHSCQDRKPGGNTEAEIPK